MGETDEMELGKKNARIRMESDRISSLPDEIIHLILSSDDIKSAVQTSVLSSRWKLIWTTLPYLNFSTRNFRSFQRFSRFVDCVFSRRNDQAEVHAMDIFINGSVNKQDVNKIANYAVSHNVQKVRILNFKSDDSKDPLLPLCLFSSQSIKDLCLIAYAGNRSYMLQQSPWDSPALTTIELNDTWLCARNTLSLDLFSKCVNLMNLTLTNCCSFGLKLLKIVCPRLLHLTISYCHHTNSFEISAPDLKSFCYKGFDTPVLLSTEGFNSLEKVNLHIDINGQIQETREDIQNKAHDYINFLHKLHNARFVTLTGSVIVLLSKVLDLPEHQHSPFSNLKSLSVEGVKTLRNCPKSDLTSQVTNYLWNSSQSMTSSIEIPEEINANKPIHLCSDKRVKQTQVSEKLKGSRMFGFSESHLLEDTVNAEKETQINQLKEQLAQQTELISTQARAYQNMMMQQQQQFQQMMMQQQQQFQHMMCYIARASFPPSLLPPPPLPPQLQQNSGNSTVMPLAHMFNFSNLSSPTMIDFPGVSPDLSQFMNSLVTPPQFRNGGGST